MGLGNVERAGLLEDGDGKVEGRTNGGQGKER